MAGFASSPVVREPGRTVDLVGVDGEQRTFRAVADPAAQATIPSGLAELFGSLSPARDLVPIAALLAADAQEALLAPVAVAAQFAGIQEVVRGIEASLEAQRAAVADVLSFASASTLASQALVRYTVDPGAALADAAALAGGHAGSLAQLAAIDAKHAISAMGLWNDAAITKVAVASATQLASGIMDHVASAGVNALSAIADLAGSTQFVADVIEQVSGAARSAVGAFPAFLRRQPRTWSDDLHILRTSGDPTEVAAALDRTADRIRWAPRFKPRVWRALATRARLDETDTVTVKRHQLWAAIYLVLGDADRPQCHRFGRGWLVGDDGRRVMVAPDDLPASDYWEWFCDAVVRVAEAALLEEPYPAASDLLRRGRSRVPLDGDDEAQASAELDPLHALLTQEQQREDTHRLLRVLTRETPRQRQILSLIAGGMSLADAARRLGITPATARAQMAFLRRATA